MQIASETPVDKRICPQCGGPKKGSAKQCKPCYYDRGYKPCTVPMCTNVAMTHGLCNTHRLRMKRNGTVEHLCSVCGEQATNLAGASRCDTCRAAGRIATQRKADVKRLYGLTWDEFTALADRQGGACAICRTADPGRGHDTFSVDHDHVTGRVRGLLCHRCNVALGLMGDDPTILTAAIRYLAT